MNLGSKEFLTRGAYADIFRPGSGARVYKLFISTQHNMNVSQGLTNPERQDCCRKTFQSECEAYERAGLDPYLCAHIPRFFERCAVEDVADSTGSISNRYILDCCYGMEYIAGEDRKLGTFRPEEYPDHIRTALDAFREAGIHHVKDASVFFPEDRDMFIFIDFAIEEFLAIW